MKCVMVYLSLAVNSCRPRHSILPQQDPTTKVTFVVENTTLNPLHHLRDLTFTNHRKEMG